MRAGLAAALLLLSGAVGYAEPIIGRVSVVDGDTIDTGAERIRFHGIDAPEMGQRCGDGRGATYRCGKVAADALDAFLAASRPTRCEFIAWEHFRDRRGRPQKRFVGDCYRSDGKSVNQWLVRNGHALDWPYYSGGAYANLQVEARRAGRGIWRGQFVPPWRWRQERR